MNKTFKKFADLVRHLPTGTVFLFLFLNPVFTNEGSCQTINKVLTGLLLCFCGLACFLCSFTDSYRDTDGDIHYGIATISGFWPQKHSSSVNFSYYKLRVSDFVHAFLSLTVFAVLALLYPTTLKCFYPSIQTVWFLKWLPLLVGILSAISAWFPNKRHGIGYISSDYTLIG